MILKKNRCLLADIEGRHLVLAILTPKKMTKMVEKLSTEILIQFTKVSHFVTEINFMNVSFLELLKTSLDHHALYYWSEKNNHLIKKSDVWNSCFRYGYRIVHILGSMYVWVCVYTGTEKDSTFLEVMKNSSTNCHARFNICRTNLAQLLPSSFFMVGP